MFNQRIQKQIRRMSDKIYNDTSIDIFVYGDPTDWDCPNCYYDHSTDSSTGVHDTSFVSPTIINGVSIEPKPFTRGRCPVCRGAGKIELENKKIMRAYVRWDPPTDGKGDFEELTLGTEGSNIVMVRTASKNYEAIRGCNYVIIDGVRCELFRPPIIRRAGREGLSVVAFFRSSEEGFSTTTR